MKLVTNTAPVIINNMFPVHIVDNAGGDWSKVKLAEIGTVFKVKAIMMQLVFLENSNCSINVDVNVFNTFFVEHEIEV